jgi:putrescine transport system ATP-binding protein
MINTNKSASIKTNPLVQIENISKQYHGTSSKAVDNINLDIYEGELFSLLGPSGCGKSTIMRMLAGFETPTSGRILINGIDMTSIPPYERPVNIMFQSYALFPHMNVRQNIAFGLKQEKLSKEEISSRVEQALEMFRIADYAERKPNQLSGGQQQRVALARSVVKRPKLLLLDEPLGALDRKTREHAQMELIKVQNLLGITFIIVTHDQEEAMSMSNRIGIMNSGKILQIGTPEDIYENPNSRFVADFIGSMNSFKGTVSSKRDDKGFISIAAKDNDQEIRVFSKDDINIDQEVWVGVRPEEIKISDNSDDDNCNKINGKILDIAFLGNQIIYHVVLASEKIVHVSVPTTAKNKNESLTVGSQAILSWHYDDGVLLVN